MNEVSLRDGRYDGIFHMVTAACGAEDHYSLDSNEARSEPLQLAKEVSSHPAIQRSSHTPTGIEASSHPAIGTLLPSNVFFRLDLAVEDSASLLLSFPTHEYGLAE